MEVNNINVNIQFEKNLIVYNEYLIGEIIMWPKASNIPDGFISCDGRSLSETTYHKLFEVIGDKFGGSSGFFNIPNLNVNDTNAPEFIKGDPNMTNTTANRILNTNSANRSGGVNQIQNSILPRHQHHANIDVTTSIINGSFNVQEAFNRINKTEIAQGSVRDGNQGYVKAYDINHRHDVIYNGRYTTSFVASYHNIDRTNFTIGNNNSSEYNVKPASSLVHYIIYCGNL
jgi:microcystin-dependent protein